jgi:hypothetical protein
MNNLEWWQILLIVIAAIAAWRLAPAFLFLVLLVGSVVLSVMFFSVTVLVIAVIAAIVGAIIGVVALCNHIARRRVPRAPRDRPPGRIPAYQDRGRADRLAKARVRIKRE